MQPFNYVIGQNEHGDECVVHLDRPRFVARIAEVGEDGMPSHPDEDADLLSGLVFSGEGFAICELAMLDHGDIAGLEQALREAGELVAALRQSLA